MIKRHFHHKPCTVRLKKSVLLVFAAHLICGSVVALADGKGGCAEIIEPDRPGATNYFNPVGVKCLQIETSVEFSEASNASAYAFPTLIRFGITEGLEARLENAVWGGGEGGDGRQDIVVGIKKRLMDLDESNTLAPGLGFTLVSIFPGGEGTDGGDISPRFDLLADWAFSNDAGKGFFDFSGLSLNSGFAWVADGNDRRVKIPLSMVLGASIPNHEDIGVFVDSGAEYDFRGSAWSQSIGGGAVYLPSKDLQLDFSGSYKVVGGDSWWVAVGISKSFDL